jgi:hypothetical protein
MNDCVNSHTDPESDCVNSHTDLESDSVSTIWHWQLCSRLHVSTKVGQLHTTGTGTRSNTHSTVVSAVLRDNKTPLKYGLWGCECECESEWLVAVAVVAIGADIYQ